MDFIGVVSLEYTTSGGKLQLFGRPGPYRSNNSLKKARRCAQER